MIAPRFPLLAALLIALVLTATASHALGPHEVLLLVNQDSEASLELANEYIHLRGIPLANVVYVSPPDTVTEPEAAISRRDFIRHVWEPAQEALRERGLEDQILAWVYSADMPVRTTSSPAMSIQGVTFLRSDKAHPDTIRQGAYASPLYAGPNEHEGPYAGSTTLDSLRATPAGSRPVPSMILGFTGSRGNTMDEMLGCLRRSAQADHSRPDGDFFFVASKDVRSLCRAWQYAAARREMNSLGLRASIVPIIPRRSRIAGAMMGTPWALKGLQGKVECLDGSMVEHLTSAAAIFHKSDQSKLTFWIERGAAASAGTVSEPYAMWTKFPGARFFAHYGRGCTMLESFYQSIRCPLQILLVGDPLANPWASPFTVSLTSSAGPTPDHMLFRARATTTGERADPMGYTFLLDDKIIRADTPECVLQLDGSALSDGYHEVRVIAHTPGPVRHQAFASEGFVVANRGRAVGLEGIPSDAKVDLYHPLAVTIAVKGGKPKRCAVVQGRRTLAQAVWDGTGRMTVDPSLLGPGPHLLQAVAHFADGGVVFSKPEHITVARLNNPPAIDRIDTRRNQDRTVTLTAQVSDPEGDPTAIRWMQPVPYSARRRTDSSTYFTLSGGSIRPIKGGILFSPSNSIDTCLFPGTEAASCDALSADVFLQPGKRKVLRSQNAGLVFGHRSAKHFSFFGALGESSAWTISTYRDGTFTHHASRGAPIRLNRWYNLALREVEGGGLEGLVDGTVVCRWAKGRLGPGPVGLVAGGEPTRFRNPLVSPPYRPRGSLAIIGSDLLVLDPAKAEGTAITVVAADAVSSSQKDIDLVPPAAK